MYEWDQQIALVRCREGRFPDYREVFSLKVSYLALSLLGGAMLFAGGAQAQGKITNHVAEGNLQVTHNVGCIAREDAKTSYTPADLYASIFDCIEKEQYGSAVDLYVMAFARGTFDMQRVKDKSAYQALSVLRMVTFQKMDEAQRTAFGAALENYSKDGIAEACEFLKGQDAPDYYPKYMIAHGMGAFTNKDDDGLVTPFDAAAAWQLTLTKAGICAGK